jgi:hypothetical protein
LVEHSSRSGRARSGCLHRGIGVILE